MSSAWHEAVDKMIVDFKTWKKQVDELFRERYRTSWTDLCGDDTVLVAAKAAGDTPDKFVEWFAEKYDLVLL